MSKPHPIFQEIFEEFRIVTRQQHHRRCAAWGSRGGECNRNCAAIQEAIDAFNADDSKTHRSDPDSREHYYARFPILAEDCDYEVSGFSGVQGRGL